MGRFDWLSNLVGRGGRGGTKKGLDNIGNVKPKDVDVKPKDVDVKPKDVKKSDAQALQNAPTPEAKNLAEQANVKDAAKTKKDDLAKLGLQGAAGVAALMILTGESNPIKAVEAAVDGASKAAKTARDAASGGLNIIDQLISFFTNFGLYICICCSCIIFLIAIFMIL
jgi:hypothetical protein